MNSTKQAQHTPGPWHIGRKPGPIVYGPKGEQVADMRETLLLPDEHAANIQLISAAPDLLEILTRILRCHDSGNNGAYSGEAILCPMFADMARAAIAKAKGE